MAKGRYLLGTTAGLVLLIAVAATLVLRSQSMLNECQPVFPTPNAPRGLDLGYVKARNHQAAGTTALGSPLVTGRFRSGDSRNFAVQVSVGEYSSAFGLPATDAQNIFYGSDPSRRVVLVFSYGSFDWTFSGETAASAPAVPAVHYSAAMAALDALTGAVIIDQTPACK